MSTLATLESKTIPALAPGIAQRINALHDDARRLEKESRQKLHKAVNAAWQAGKLLREAKTSSMRHSGRGAWIPWLQTMFEGGIRCACGVAGALCICTAAVPRALACASRVIRLFQDRLLYPLNKSAP